MALVTVEELEAFMGRTFDATEEAQAEMLIQVASDVIESETGVSFSLHIDDEIRVQCDGYGVFEFSAKPIQSVAVYPIDGDVNTELEYATWDGQSAIYGLQPNEVVDVVYTHGYTSVPGDIKSVCYGVCSRIMYNPSGLRQETVGAISVTYPGIGGEAGTINFSNLEKRVLDKYSKTEKSMRMAVQRRRLNSLPVLTIDNDIA
jgi:hypothetical protein